MNDDNSNYMSESVTPSDTEFKPSNFIVKFTGALILSYICIGFGISSCNKQNSEYSAAANVVVSSMYVQKTNGNNNYVQTYNVARFNSQEWSLNPDVKQTLSDKLINNDYINSKLD